MLWRLRFVLDFASVNSTLGACSAGRTALRAGRAAQSGEAFSCQPAMLQGAQNGGGLDTGVYTHQLVDGSWLKKNQDQLMFSDERIGPHKGFR
ncbi:hypothetical protein [Achromobacter kerstersii]